MKVIFFAKKHQFYVDCKNTIEISENVYCFWDNGVWTYLGNFSQFWGEYMGAAVNLLPNSPKNSHPTKRVVL